LRGVARKDVAGVLDQVIAWGQALKPLRAAPKD
jgi:hypothetical protein